MDDSPKNGQFCGLTKRTRLLILAWFRTNNLSQWVSNLWKFSTEMHRVKSQGGPFPAGTLWDSRQKLGLGLGVVVYSDHKRSGPFTLQMFPLPKMQLFWSPIFLVSGSLYKALYEATFVSVVRDLFFSLVLSLVFLVIQSTLMILLELKILLEWSLMCMEWLKWKGFSCW